MKELRIKHNVFWKLTIQYATMFIILYGLLLFTKAFLIDIYYVPTSSMENTIRKDSYILVDKHGVRTKIINSILSEYSINQKVLSIDRGDILLSHFNRTGVKIVKRAVAISRDTLLIENGITYINDLEQSLHENTKYTFKSKLKKSEAKKFNEISKLVYVDIGTYEITISGKELREVRNQYPFLELISNKQKEDKGEHGIVPICQRSSWDRNNYGPFIIPYKGMELDRNNINYYLYENVLNEYENTVKESFFSFKDGQKFIFENDYIFFMGDDRMNSFDSRFLGAFPESSIIGKVIYIL